MYICIYCSSHKTCLCMYVCVCMYVYMYICIHIALPTSINVSTIRTFGMCFVSCQIRWRAVLWLDE